MKPPQLLGSSLLLALLAGLLAASLSKNTCHGQPCMFSVPLQPRGICHSLRRDQSHAEKTALQTHPCRASPSAAWCACLSDNLHSQLEAMTAWVPELRSYIGQAMRWHLFFCFHELASDRYLSHTHLLIGVEKMIECKSSLTPSMMQDICYMASYTKTLQQC